MASLHSSSRARALALTCLALAFCAMAAHLTRGDNAGAAPVSGSAADALGIDPAATDAHGAPEAAPLLIEQDADDVPATKKNGKTEAKGAEAAETKAESEAETPAVTSEKPEVADETAKPDASPREETKSTDQDALKKDDASAKDHEDEAPKKDDSKNEAEAHEEDAVKQEDSAKGEQSEAQSHEEDTVKQEDSAKGEQSEAKSHEEEAPKKDDSKNEAEGHEEDVVKQDDSAKDEQSEAKTADVPDSLKIIEAPVKDGKPAFLMEDHALPIISLQFSFPGGGYAHEPEKFAGTASLAVSALDEGAGKYTPSDFKRLLQRLHAEVNFSADEDGFYVTLTTLTSGLDKSLEIVADLLAAPAYEKADLPRHIGAVLTAVKERDSDPGQAGMAELKKRVWGTHPYARDALGTEESVKRVTPALLRSYHQEAVNPAVMRVAAAGDVTPEGLSALSDRFMEKLRAAKAGKQTAPAFLIADLPPAVYRPEAFERLHIERDIPQTIVLFALPGVTRNDPAFFNYYVANYLLGGGGFESRLMHKLREEKAYAYSVNTGLIYGLNGAMLTGSAGVSSANADAFLTELKAILDSGEPYGKEEIADAKSHMERAFALSLSNNAAQAGMLAGLQLYGFGPDYMSVRLKKLADVTPESLADVLNAVWRSDKMIAVTVGRSGDRASGAPASPSASETVKPAAAAPERPQAGHGGSHPKRGKRHGGH